jgi:hypothetical protein
VAPWANRTSRSSEAERETACRNGIQTFRSSSKLGRKVQTRREKLAQLEADARVFRREIQRSLRKRRPKNLLDEKMARSLVCKNDNEKLYVRREG